MEEIRFHFDFERVFFCFFLVKSVVLLIKITMKEWNIQERENILKVLYN